jgi:WD40 repeat protein/serine/threonine protein kinase
MPNDGALSGGCPRCMLELGFETSRGSADGSKLEVNADRPTAIGRYQILRLIGEGGMGAVYEAEQEHPRRKVALKIIKHGMASPELLRRFEQESQALGRLQHPGIAQIYEAGTVDTGFGPQPYFAMEFIRGVPPRDYAEAHHLNTNQRLEIMAKICEAVHHAHQRGLIHRDLKPANILVDDTGQPKILDFGVARVTDSDARSTLQTDMGQLIGTLAYMSPEQALADPLDIDTRSDVYSLGVILYELLTGQLPYPVSRKIHEAIQAIREADPVRISLINRMYRGDIETIVNKALEKDRSCRYPSASGMAADLHRYLTDEPISARPPSASYQLRKLAHRHRVLVLAITAVLVILVCGISVTTWQASVARRERDHAKTSEQTATVERDNAVVAKKQATVAEEEARKEASLAVLEKQRADTEAESAKTNFNLGLWRSLASQSLQDSEDRGDDDRAMLLARQALLFHLRTPDQPRYPVEYALQRASSLGPSSHDLLPDQKLHVLAVRISPDGNRLAVASKDGDVRTWNLHNPAAPAAVRKIPELGMTGGVFVAFSADAERLAIGGVAGIQIWDLRNPNAQTLALSDSGSASGLAFSRDGSLFASGRLENGDVRIWNLTVPGSRPRLLKGTGNATSSLAFSPDSGRLAASGFDASVRMWDLSNSEFQSLRLRQSQPLMSSSVVFSPDGTKLASAATDVMLWDLSKPNSNPIIIQSRSAASKPNDVSCLTFSSDGTRLAVGSGESVQVWNIQRIQDQPLLLRSVHDVTAIAFYGESLNDGRLAIGTDETAQVWDLQQPNAEPPSFSIGSNLDTFSSLGTLIVTSATQQKLPPWYGIYSVAFLPNSSRLVTGGAVGSIQIWDLLTPGSQSILLPSSASGRKSILCVAISQDGQLFSAGAEDGTIRIWKMRDLNAPPRLLRDSAAVESLAFSSDSSRLTVVDREHIARLWDLRTLNQPPEILWHQNADIVALSSSGDHLAAVDEKHSVQVWNLLRPAEAPARMINSTEISSLAFSLDGARLAAGGVVNDRALRVWDLRHPDQPPLMIPNRSNIMAIAFSPDGERLATANEDNNVLLWDLRMPGSSPISFRGPPPFSSDTVWVAFSPDGRRIFSGSGLGSISSWQVWFGTADYLCTRVWRNLSADEWRFYVGGNIPYQRTCPALPPGDGAPR